MSAPTFGVPITVISNSGSVTASGATPNLRTQQPSTGYRQIPASESVTFVLSVTSNAGTGGTNNLWVQFEHSPDGGTTWIPALRFTQVTSSTTSIMATVRTNGIGANEAAVNAGVVSSTSALIVNNFVMSADQRVVWTLGNAGQTVTFGVFAFAQPVGSRVSY